MVFYRRTRCLTALLLCLAVIHLSILTPSLAANPKTSDQNVGIPKKPSAPPSLTVKPPSDTFRCQRFFVYQHKKIACDSNIQLDGEQLRPLMEGVPQATAELDLYQKNRVEIRQAAYIGSVGLLVMVTGALLSLHYRDHGAATNASLSIRSAAIIGGGGIMIGSFLSALSFIKNNETHLGNAVNYFNEAHPDTPIELQFNTGINF